MNGRSEPEAPPVDLDLYLGGDLGAWAMHEVDPGRVRTVVTLDDEIAEAADRLHVPQLRGTPDPEVVEPGAIAICVHYPKIFPGALIDRYRVMYNLHPGYLPWGRGFYPVFWALWEDTPAGATLHEITEKLDQGPIVMQVRVPHSPEDTGGSLHRRVRDAERQLFRALWLRIRDGDVLPRQPPPQAQGSYHSRSEFVELRDRADVNSLTAGELLQLIRCLTFPGLPGLRVQVGKRRFHVRLEELEAE